MDSEKSSINSFDMKQKVIRRFIGHFFFTNLSITVGIIFMKKIYIFNIFNLVDFLKLRVTN